MSQPLSSLRLRWRWVVGAFLVGLLLGALVSGPTSYKATSIMEITQSGDDSLRIQQLGQTVESTATSSVVVADAARSRRISASDLAARLTVVWKQDSDIVNVTVRAADARSAVTQANAVANAITTVADRQSADQVNQISREGDDLLTSGALADKKAETERRTQLGAAIAGQQSDAVAGATSVQLVGPARTADPTGIPRPVGAALGAFALAALAAAAAMLASVGRLRVRDPKQLDVLLPGVRVRSALAGAGELAGRLSESRGRDLVVVAMDDVDAAEDFRARVVDLLGVHGVPVTTGPAAAPTAARWPVPVGGVDGVHPNGVADAAAQGWVDPTAHGDAGHNGDEAVRVILSSSDDGSLSLLDGRTRLLAVVVATAGEQRVDDLQRVVSRLRYADPTVILTS
jgi:hypothetical protein